MAVSEWRDQNAATVAAPRYAIRVRGHLGTTWADWFVGLEVLLDDTGDTLLMGEIADQAALHALLRTIRDLGLPLVSINRLDAAGREDQPRVEIEGDGDAHVPR